jgi:hypothetical protein
MPVMVGATAAAVKGTSFASKLSIKQSYWGELVSYLFIHHELLLLRWLNDRLALVRWHFNL